MLPELRRSRDYRIMPLVRSGASDSTLGGGSKLPRPVRWGHVSHFVSRHGVRTSRLVVYSPVSSDRERFRAWLSGAFAPVGLGAGVVGWLLCVAAGLSPEGAAIGFAIVGTSIGVFLWWRARPLRGRVATAWSSRSVLRPSRDDDEREEMIMELSLLMQQATDDLRHGRIPRSVYERVWMAVYEETYALAAGDQPSKSQR